MNCRQFDKTIVNLACDQVTDVVAQRDALAHAQDCAQCGARLARQQTVARQLRALAAQEQTINAPAHLSAALLSAFEQERAVATQESVFPRPNWRGLFSWWNWRWAAAMATLLILFGLEAARRRTPLPVPPPNTELTAKNALTPASNKTTEEAPPKSRNFRPLPRKRMTPRDAEDYGALISLMPIAPDEAEEFQQVVRMRIPRSTLRLWGLSLNDDSNNEQISAEVFFSEDGVARAIRLRN